MTRRKPYTAFRNTGIWRYTPQATWCFVWNCAWRWLPEFDQQRGWSIHWGWLLLEKIAFDPWDEWGDERFEHFDAAVEVMCNGMPDVNEFRV